ncbi:hypothetical protein SH668x_001633 [Planctomicrobium sp. SH668]|uniref:hypothetical protein n=1 Tax=Planctomicrobium sp. SH668 TaxID=3448126 RepID=UPI003F5B4364
MYWIELLRVFVMTMAGSSLAIDVPTLAPERNPPQTRPVPELRFAGIQELQPEIARVEFVSNAEPAPAELREQRRARNVIHAVRDLRAAGLYFEADRIELLSLEVIAPGEAE